jgi:hypothetical protein
MRSHRKILSTLTSLTVTAMFVAMPSSVLAGPLLGGYGGPGEGNQAILGSALVGGGGSGSSGGGSAGSTGSSLSVAAGAGAQAGRGQGNVTYPDSSGLGSAAGEGGRSAGETSGAQDRSAAKTSGGTANPYPVSTGRAASQSAAPAADTLGLSGADLAYICLTVCALVFAGVLTKRLAHAAGPQGTQMTKGTAHRTRVTE